MSSKSYSHLPGPLKQVNKIHKSGAHKSKRAHTNEYKAKNASKKPNKILIKSKSSRVNERKRKIIDDRKKLNENFKEVGFGIAPIPIVLISISDDFPIENIIDTFRGDANFTVECDWLTAACRDFYHIESKDKKQKYLFLALSQLSAYYAHDIISAAQAVWVLSSDISERNTDIKSLFQTFGSVSLPPVYHILKIKNNNTKQINNFLKDYGHQFGPFTADKDNVIKLDGGNISLPKLSKCIPHFYLQPNYFTKYNEKQKQTVTVISDKLEFSSENNVDMLIVEGFIRGGALSANDSVCIPGFGNFKLSKIEEIPELNSPQNYNDVTNVLSIRSSEFSFNFDSSHPEHELDSEKFSEFSEFPMNNDFNFFEPTSVNTMDIDYCPSPNSLSQPESDEDTDSMSITDEFNTNGESNATEDKFTYLTSIDACGTHRNFCDNPLNRRIIKFQQFAGIRNRVIQHKYENAVPAGRHVRISIPKVSLDAYDYFSKTVGRLVLYRLYPFEDQLSIVQFFIHKTGYSPDVFSNKKYVFFCGPHRFTASCLLSSPSSKKREFYKVLSVVSGEAHLIVSLVAYCIFPQASVTMFSRSDDGELSYIGGGHVLNPTVRLLVKELVLTGVIHKVFKKSIVVSGLFNTREEVLHFMSVDIYTDRGDKGHIIKPIGTHGSMKCFFSIPTFKRQKVVIQLYKPQHPVCDIEPAII